MRLPTPRELCRASPTSPEIEQFVERARQRIRQCLEVEDERLLVIVGPCSVQDPDSLLGYAERLSQLQRQLSDRLLLVLRAHFEKPRTSTGWKGFLYDPHLNGSNDMPYALRTMRQLLLELAHMELPVATEFLEPTTPAYIGDLISWATVGARTVASQIHRQMASGLSMPVGFKNTPEGDIETALHALQTARLPHSPSSPPAAIKATWSFAAAAASPTTTAPPPPPAASSKKGSPLASSLTAAMTIAAANPSAKSMSFAT
jgi:3-deoxy-7-phosphoheptulonate synthase